MAPHPSAPPTAAIESVLAFIKGGGLQPASKPGFAHSLKLSYNTIAKDKLSVTNKNKTLTYRYRLSEHVPKPSIGLYTALMDELSTDAFFVAGSPSPPGVSLQLQTELLTKPCHHKQPHPQHQVGSEIDVVNTVTKLGKTVSHSRTDFYCVATQTPLAFSSHVKYMPTGSRLLDLLFTNKFLYGLYTKFLLPRRGEPKLYEERPLVKDVIGSSLEHHGLGRASFHVTREHTNGFGGLHGGCHAMVMEQVGEAYAKAELQDHDKNDDDKTLLLEGRFLSNRPRVCVSDYHPRILKSEYGLSVFFPRDASPKGNPMAIGQLAQHYETPHRIRVRQYSSTPQSPSPATTTDSTSQQGEVVYQQALKALEKVEELQEARETKKSEEMHKAIEKAEAKQQAHSNNPKAQNLKGVTVIKTVVKQTRKEQKNAPNIQQLEEETRAEALTLLRTAGIEYGHPEALILLGNGELEMAKELWRNIEKDKKSMTEQRALEPVQASVKQSLEYYQRAGEKGAATGWFNVGQLLWTGFPAADKEEDEENNVTANDVNQLILSPDRAASMDAFRKAIDLGDADAMYFVGVWLLGDEDKASSSVSSLQEGLELIQSSAALGHGPARYYLALFHLNGHEGLNIDPCSPGEFVDYLNAAVDAEDADALFLRGTFYCGREQDTYGYPCDMKLALQDFLASAEAGNADAAVSAGALLFEGRPGVLPQDQKRAFELYQMAGEMGSLEGWRNVAACYAEGKGVPQSLPTAKYIIKTMLREGDNSSL